MKNNKLLHALKKNINSTPRLFSTLLDNYLVAVTNKSPKRGPLFAVWNLTTDCNLRCPFCDSWKTNHSHSHEKTELTSEGKIKIINNLAKGGVWFLSLCGGEPLLCADTEDIIKIAKSNSMIINVSTNGLLLEEKAEALINAGIDFITISLDGYNAELHDSMRRYAGLFKKIENGIKAMRALSESSPVFIELRYLINKKNYLFIEDFVEAFLKKADSITFKPIYNNSHVRYSIPEDMKFYPEDEGLFLKHFNGFLKKYKYFDTAYHRNIPTFIFHPDQLKGRYFCFSGAFFGAIDFAGRLFPCHEMTMAPNTAVGNLNGSGLVEIWSGRDMNKLRKLFREGLRCDCWMDRFYLNIPLQKILRPAYSKAKKPQA